MQEILDLMVSKALAEEKTLTEEEVILDQSIRENLKEECLEKYLKLQDSIMTNRFDGEKRAYKKGFVAAIHLLKKLDAF